MKTTILLILIIIMNLIMLGMNFSNYIKLKQIISYGSY